MPFQPQPEVRDTGVDAAVAPGGWCAAVAPAAWPDGCFALVHELWGDAKDAKPYCTQQKRKWQRLLGGLERHHARAQK